MSRKLDIQQHSLRTFVLGLPKLVRLIGGAMACAIISYVTATLLIGVTGRWMNRGAVLADVLVESSLLAVVSTLGYRTRKFSGITMTILALFMSYEIQHYVRSPAPFIFGDHWPEFFLPLASLLFNLYLFSNYARGAELL